MRSRSQGPTRPARADLSWPTNRNNSNNRKIVMFAYFVLYLLVVIRNHYIQQQSLSDTIPQVECSSAFLLKANSSQQNLILLQNLDLPSINRTTNDNNKAVSRQKIKPIAANKRNPVPRNYQQNNEADSSSSSSSDEQPLQVSITPRVMLLRVPAESNAILKCLISSSHQSNKFNKKFDIHWSRYIYGENVFEQIDLGSSDYHEDEDSSSSTDQTNESASSSTISPNLTLNDQDPLLMKEFEPVNRQQQLRDFIKRTRQETNIISDLLIEATLVISPAKAIDNASYYCTVSDGHSDQNKARIDLVVLSKPVVHLERVYPARDSKSALIHWLVLSDGNTPIKKTILMIRNDTNYRIQSQQDQISSSDQQQQTNHLTSVVIDSDYNQWQRIEIPDDGEPANELLAHNSSAYDQHSSNQLTNNNLGGDSVVRADLDSTSSIPGNSGHMNSSSSSQEYMMSSRSRWRFNNRFNKRHLRRSFNLSSLLPGVTYNFRLAAINDMGQSNWTQLISVMPNEIPAQISEVFMLSRSNDSLAIGWRRPSYDNARTIRYEMQLFDLNRTLTLDANTNTSLPSSGANNQKTNFMYIFVNLNPGTDYHFHVRACSKFGCSLYSQPKLLASTMDGESDEPLDVELTCEYNSKKIQITWMPPINTKGQLVNYNIILDSYARYKNSSNQWSVDEWRTTMETYDNYTLRYELAAPFSYGTSDQRQFQLLPNTNYSVRVCANNRSKHCGKLSLLNQNAQCTTPPEMPQELPLEEMKLVQKNVTLMTRNRNKQYSHEDGVSIAQHEGQKLESLVLELPWISLRNGSIDCVQIMLIRLPKSFDGNNRMLSNYLPNQPSEIRVSPFHSLNQLQQNESAKQVDINEDAVFAYLAEELSSLQQNDEFMGANEGGDRLLKQDIVLGDGSQQVCDMKTRDHSSIKLALKPFDRPLMASTYYTGFIKLIINRIDPAQQRSKPNLAHAQSNHETLVKYSNYFQPTKTGETVIEVLFDEPTKNPFAINSSMSFQEITQRLGQSLSLSAKKLYNQASNYLQEKVIRLDVVGNFITQSSPIMQLLIVGLTFVVSALLLIFFIYLLSRPAAIRRKRKRKLKRKLQKHQEIANGNYQQQQALQSNQQQQQAPVLLAVANMGYQPVDMSAINQQPSSIDGGQMIPDQQQLHKPADCPIHSSPLNHTQQHGHVCNPDHIHHQHQQHELARQEQYERNCRTMRRQPVVNGNMHQQLQQGLDENGTFTLNHQNLVMNLAKKFNKSIPLRLFGTIFDKKLKHGWLTDEYEQLPRPELIVGNGFKNCWLSLKPQMVVSRDDAISALISGRDRIDASLIKSPQQFAQQIEKSIIVAKSPLDADSVWDFWRLIYEQEVETVVMLTQTEDISTGELRCAQYWPTQDNEETTILSPCNEFVQKSEILPAKFKIKQETLSLIDDELIDQNDNQVLKLNDYVKLRKLTLVVMATKQDDPEAEADPSKTNNNQTRDMGEEEDDAEVDEESDSVIVERTVFHLQYYHWNTSSLTNQMRLIKFIEYANEKHSRESLRYKESPSQATRIGPLLVHCYTGLGRSGLFTAMSYIIEELSFKLGYHQHQTLNLQQQQQLQKISIYQIVSKLRLQRDMLLSPYRFYELLYQLTANCIPNQQEILLPHHHNHHHNHHHSHHHHQAQQQQQMVLPHL